MEGSIRNSSRESRSNVSPAVSRAYENEHQRLIRSHSLEASHRSPDLQGWSFQNGRASGPKQREFPRRMLQVRFLAAKLPAAKFAFHLDVCSRHGNKWGKGGFTAKTSIFKSLKLRFVSS